MDSSVERLAQLVDDSDAIVIGAGSGMSNAAGMNFWYEADPVFLRHFGDFYHKYGSAGLFNTFYTRLDSPQERAALMIRTIAMVLTEPAHKPTYIYLRDLLGKKPVHIITTNQDTLFQRFFPVSSISEIQGSEDLLQAHDTSTDVNLYPAINYVARTLGHIDGTRLPQDLIPRSPVNGSVLQQWFRSPEFLERDHYNEQYQKANHFISQHKNEKILFVEMGVGRMTPMFIQEPFWEMTHVLPHAFYVNINPKDAVTHPVIQDRSLLVREDITAALRDAARVLGHSEQEDEAQQRNTAAQAPIIAHNKQVIHGDLTQTAAAHAGIPLSHTDSDTYKKMNSMEGYPSLIRFAKGDQNNE